MNNIFVKVAIISAVFLPTIAMAGPIIRSGESVSIDASQTLKGDFYGFAPTVTLSGKAENDVYVAGGTVTINAPVAQDLTIVGGVVQVHDEIGDDLRVIGGEVTLAKAVKGDVVVLAGTLTILSTATIEGDILFLGGDLIVEGEVAGSVNGNAETVRLNSKIGGDVSIKAKTSFFIGDHANILGNVQYESTADMVRAQDAVIIGSVRKGDIVEESRITLAKQLMLRVVILLFSALVVFLTLRKYVQEVVTISMQNPGVSGLVGLGTFVIVPFVSVLFLVSVLGSPIGIILFALYILMIVFSFLGVGMLIGVYVQKLLTKKSNIALSTVVLGFVSLGVLLFIPIVGALILFWFTMMTLGGMSTALYRALRA